MPNDDRVYQAYAGELGEEQQNKTRFRIDWILERAGGYGTVLDAGCSQGIVSLLLAQKGAQVTGIDIQQESIDFANRLLADKYPQAAGNIQFLCKDMMDFESDGRFDCIVMTEVLEHLREPAFFLRKAASLLKEGGRLVITVPFGVMDHPDHFSTFYLGGIYDLVSRYFSITQVAFMGRWLGLVASHSQNAGWVFPLDAEAIRAEEQNFYQIDRELNDKAAQYYQSMNRANGLYAQSTKNYDALKEKLNEANLAYQKLLEREGQLNVKYQEALQNYEKAKQWHAASQGRLSEEKKNREALGQELEAQKQRFEKESHLNRQEIEALQEQNSALQALSHELETQKGELEAQKRELETQKNGLQAHIQALHSQLTALNADKAEMAGMLNFCAVDTAASEEILAECKKSLQRLQTQNDYLKRENAEYRRKLSLITDTWYGQWAIKCYHLLKRLKVKLMGR